MHYAVGLQTAKYLFLGTNQLRRAALRRRQPHEKSGIKRVTGAVRERIAGTLQSDQQNLPENRSGPIANGIPSRRFFLSVIEIGYFSSDGRPLRSSACTFPCLPTPQKIHPDDRPVTTSHPGPIETAVASRLDFTKAWTRRAGR
jgi:hypothetical protein